MNQRKLPLLLETIINMVRRYRDALRLNLQVAALIRKNPTLNIEPGVVLKGRLQNLVLGRRIVIQSGTVLHLGGMDWCEGKGYLEIGDDSVISPNCVIYAAGPGGIRIGTEFDCGPGTGIFASRRDYRRDINSHVFLPVEIGDRVTLFANVVISPGVKIGSDAAVAAGSVVVQDVPENVLVGGVPARILRENIRERHVRNH